jgi:S1-C subfamily serine protease
VLLTAANGRRVGSLVGYCRAMATHRSGDTVELSVVRTAGGQEQPIRIKLE